MTQRTTRTTTSHWGAFDVTVQEGRITKTSAFDDDPAPPGISRFVPAAVHHRTRVDRPYISKSWLERRGGTRQDRDDFVAVPWDEALDIAATEIARIKSHHGNGSIFGGSYGWASAGRFHHAQSQVHRFLNAIGGYVSSYASYSTGAAQAVIPHVLGMSFHKVMWGETNSWSMIEQHTDTLVMFGGINPKNAQVSMGGVTEHRTAQHVDGFAALGKRLVSISPQRDDSPDCAEWIPVPPGTDVALMLGLAYTLDTEGLADQDFLDRYCEGYDRFRPYLLGTTDGTPKSANWAQDHCGVPADQIRALARHMSQGRTLVSVAWSLQRARHGEQPFWMATVLAAMLGQVGLPGGGIGFGYGAIGNIGHGIKRLQGPLFEQGENPVSDFIPVSRIADMLLNPGGPYDFNGQARIYPDIRLVYWCGGNPFHHHQDLNRLARAWEKPDTIIVHEPWWTATAQRADIVFPATTQFEREDIGWAKGDPYLFHMPQMIPPVAEARNDYDIFAGLSKRLGSGQAFTQGRTSEDWIKAIYATFADNAKASGTDVPGWDDLKSRNFAKLPLEQPQDAPAPFAAFRHDPAAHPLGTPSGRIEIFSDTINSFGYAEVPGHPVWLPPETDTTFPFRLVSPQPGDKLHSQLQSAIVETSNRPMARLVMNPLDAVEHSVGQDDVVRVWNRSGACIASLDICDTVMRGVVSLPTGGWFAPDADGTDTSGNPNTLTQDCGTSPLGQGAAAHNVGVAVTRYEDGPS